MSNNSIKEINNEKKNSYIIYMEKKANKVVRKHVKKPLDRIQKGKLTRQLMLKYAKVLSNPPYNYNLIGYSKLSDVDLLIHIREGINLVDLRKIAKNVGVKNARKMNKIELDEALSPNKVIKHINTVINKRNNRQALQEDQQHRELQNAENKANKLMEKLKKVEKSQKKKKDIKKETQEIKKELKEVKKEIYKKEFKNVKEELTDDDKYKYKTETVDRVGIINVIRFHITENIPQSRQEYIIAVRDIIKDYTDKNENMDHGQAYFKIMVEDENGKIKFFSISIANVFAGDLSDEEIGKAFEEEYQSLTDKKTEGSDEINDETDSLVLDKFDVIFKNKNLTGKGRDFKHNILKYKKSEPQIKDRCFYNCLRSKGYDVIKYQTKLFEHLESKIEELKTYCYMVDNKEPIKSGFEEYIKTMLIDIQRFINEETLKQIINKSLYDQIKDYTDRVMKSKKDYYMYVVWSNHADKKIELYEKYLNLDFFIVGMTKLNVIAYVLKNIFDDEIVITAAYPTFNYNCHISEYFKCEKTRRKMKRVHNNNLSFSFYCYYGNESYTRKRAIDITKRTNTYIFSKKVEFEKANYYNVKLENFEKKLYPFWFNCVNHCDIDVLFPNTRHFLLYEFTNEHFEIADNICVQDNVYYDATMRYNTYDDEKENYKIDVMPMTQIHNQDLKTKNGESTKMRVFYTPFDYETVANFSYANVNKEYSIGFLCLDYQVLKAVNEFFELARKYETDKNFDRDELIRSYFRFFRSFRSEFSKPEDEEIYKIKNYDNLSEKQKDFHYYYGLVNDYKTLNELIIQNNAEDIDTAIITRNYNVDVLINEVIDILKNNIGRFYAGFDCSNKFIDFLMKNQHNKIFKLISFNGVNFDNYILYKALLNNNSDNELTVKKELIASGQFLYLEINKRHSVFDVRKFVTGRLKDCCKNYKIPECFYKVKGFRHWDMQQRYLNDEEEFINFCKTSKELREYNVLDVLSLSFIFYKSKLGVESTSRLKHMKMEDHLTLGHFTMKHINDNQKKKGINQLNFQFDKNKACNQLYNNMELFKDVNIKEKFAGIIKLEEQVNKILNTIKDKNLLKALKENYTEYFKCQNYLKYFHKSDNPTISHDLQVKMSEYKLNIDNLNYKHDINLFCNYYGNKTYNMLLAEEYNRNMVTKVIDLYKKIRKNRIGGRVQLFNGMKRFIGKIFSMDICSLYPYIMLIHKCYFPHGDIVQINSYENFNHLRKEKPILLGHFNIVKLDQSKLKIKLYPEKSDDGNEWEHNSILKENMLSSIMIDKMISEGLKYGEDIIVGDGFYYTEVCKNYEMFEPLLDIMKLKNEQDALPASERNPTQRQTYKDVLCIPSGKMSQCVYVKKRKIMSPGEYENFVKPQVFVNSDSDFKGVKIQNKNINCIDIIAGKIHVTYKVDEDEEIKSKAKAIMVGSLIYDYSRIYMYNLYKQIPYEEMIYTDTDSIKITPKGFEVFNRYISNTIVPHWEESEDIDPRYKTHKIYEPKSKVFGSLEDEYAASNFNLHYFCAKKFYACFEVPEIEKYITQEQINNNVKFDKDIVKQINSSIYLNNRELKKVGKAGITTSMKGVSKNFLIVNKSDIEPFYIKEKKKYNIEELAKYYNTQDDMRLKKNYITFFEKVYFEKQVNLLCFSINRIHSNTANNVTIKDVNKFNKIVYSTTSNYMVKDLKF